MAEFFCYEGLRNGGTFKVSEDTKTTIESNVRDIVGKVVTRTGNGEVGYGSAGDVPLGFVEQVEKESVNSDTLVVSVVWNQSREDIPCAGTETVSGNSFMECDGKGGLKAATSYTNAMPIWVKADTKTCAVKIHG